MTLTKSEYMMFLRHPALLWLKKYDKSKLPTTDENLQAMFDAGHLFESYAEQLFPEAIVGSFDLSYFFNHKNAGCLRNIMYSDLDMII